MKQFIKKIIAWLKDSRHAQHLGLSALATYVCTPLFGAGLGIGVEFGQGFKGDYKQDLLADLIGILLGSGIIALVVCIWGWQGWFISNFVLSIVAQFVVYYYRYIRLKNVSNLIPLALLLYSILAFIGIVIFA